ncbi:MAG: hypothetical protein K1X95_01180 [Acidimicrobiia bacterium]|nr:hypothetical protein [Acidimicrobiia bacterium]
MCFSPLDPGPTDPEVLRRRAAATTAVRSRAGADVDRFAPAAIWPTSDARHATAAGRSPRPPNNTSIPALRRRNDPVAVAALVSGLLALGPIAMLLGVWGRRRVHARPARGGYALASIGLWLGLAASLVYLWMLLESGGAGTV